MGKLAAVVAVVSCALLGIAAAPAGAARSGTPNTGVSSNWSGYAVTAAGTSFTDVKGSWVQPAVTCTGRAASYSSFWIGLGGYATGSKALDQIGTSADCQTGGVPSYYAWYELVPAGPVSIPLAVVPGDTVNAEVSVVGTTVTLTITDATSGATYSTQATVMSPDLTAAEWIAEAPSRCLGAIDSSCTVLPLANFGTALFSSSSVTGNGHTGTISDDAWAPTSITLGGRGVTAAVPSSLSTDGTGFSVAWQATAAKAPVVKQKPRPKSKPRRLR